MDPDRAKIDLAYATKSGRPFGTLLDQLLLAQTELCRDFKSLQSACNLLYARDLNSENVKLCEELCKFRCFPPALPWPSGA